MKLMLLLVFACFTHNPALATTEKPSCMKYTGQEKCGYGCIRDGGRIYCGEKPGMACLTFAGRTKCGFDCKQAGGKIECGSQDGDNCVVLAGQIQCGQACRIDSGHIKCGIDPNANGRSSE